MSGTDSSGIARRTGRFSPKTIRPVILPPAPSNRQHFALTELEQDLQSVVNERRRLLWEHTPSSEEATRVQRTDVLRFRPTRDAEPTVRRRDRDMERHALIPRRQWHDDTQTARPLI